MRCPWKEPAHEVSTGSAAPPRLGGEYVVGRRWNSIYHAEMVAIMLWATMIGHFDLGGPGRPPYGLVASTEPCAMCLGAAP
jgi:tRNA(Arg) A34 adenosine deaminase TadA